MKFRNKKTRQVTNAPVNSIDPAYLPNGKIIFSRFTENDTLMAGYSLYTCLADGSGLQRITFNPHSYFAPSVLLDGRIIVVSRQLYPVVKDPAIIVLRPDGTKAELFYKGAAGSEILGKGCETTDGRIVFIETGDKPKSAGKLVSVNYNRPLHTRKQIDKLPEDRFNSVFPARSGNFLVTCNNKENTRLALFLFDSEKLALGELIYQSEEGNILEAVEVTSRTLPKKLPSEVDMGVKTGLLLCQNINVTGMNSPESGFSDDLADRIEVLGINSSLGVVKTENDGSVYLKIAADVPFRIQTLDSTGNIVNGPGGWYYLRPNERRGCVGCHEDNEITPANRYAKAVGGNPVNIPVHISGVFEKKVELE